MRDDYYELLGLRPPCTQREVRGAWRRLSLELHPDKAGAAAYGAYGLVREAYEVLSDPVARERYDQRQRWISRHPEQVGAAQGRALTAPERVPRLQVRSRTAPRAATSHFGVRGFKERSKDRA